MTPICHLKEEWLHYEQAAEGEPGAFPVFAAPVWQPIETAPHNRRLLVWSGQEMYCAHWSQNPITGDEAWIVAEWGTEGDQALVRPTHWMELPDMPHNAALTGAAKAD